MQCDREPRHGWSALLRRRWPISAALLWGTCAYGCCSFFLWAHMSIRARSHRAAWVTTCIIKREANDVNDHRLPTRCIILLFVLITSPWQPELASVSERSEAGEEASRETVRRCRCLLYACHILLMRVAGAPLSPPPDFRDTATVCRFARGRAALTRRQEGGGRGGKGRLHSEVIFIQPQSPELEHNNRWTNEARGRRGRGWGGLVLDINSWRSAGSHSVFLQGGCFTPGDCSCVGSEWFVCIKRLPRHVPRLHN